MSKRKNALPEQKTVKLIKEVKKRPCVWDTEHAEYNDKYQCMQAWLAISEELNMPDKYLRTKWKNLRDIYRKQCKKGSRRLKTWRYHNMLNFLVFKNEDENGNGDEGQKELSETFDVEIDRETSSDADVADGFVKYEPEEFPDTVYLEEDPLPEKRKRRGNDDYDVMFLKSLAPYLRQLEPMRKLVVRSRMQDMLLNEIAAQNSKPSVKS